MKKVFLSISAIALLAVSCGEDKGRDVEATEEQEVVDNSTETTSEYKTITDGSKINWFASHIGGIEPHNGFINLSDGNVKVTDGKVTNGTFTFDVTTLTDEDLAENPEKKGQLEGHLKSPDFFNVEKYPTAKFEITDIKEEASEDGTFKNKVTGNFTLLDSTKGVTFFANVNVSDTEVAVTSEKFEIDRTQWGLNYGAEGLKDAMISNGVGIEVDLKLTK